MAEKKGEYELEDIFGNFLSDFFQSDIEISGNSW